MIKEYIYKGVFTTATITNKKRYWELLIEKNNDPLELFSFGRDGKRTTNTKKRAVGIWKAVEFGELKNKEQFNK